MVLHGSFWYKILSTNCYETNSEMKATMKTKDFQQVEIFEIIQVVGKLVY